MIYVVNEIVIVVLHLVLMMPYIIVVEQRPKILTMTIMVPRCIAFIGRNIEDRSHAGNFSQSS